MKGEVSRINLRKWSVFREQSSKFLRKIRLAYAIRTTSGQMALVVTRDDDVFAINDFLDRESKPNALKKIGPLCQKKIKAFAYSNCFHVVALTDDGKVFTWGRNKHGQLGNGSVAKDFADNLTPTLVAGELANRKVVQIASGQSHVLALTEEGDVFFWGLNYGNGVGQWTEIDPYGNGSISEWPKRVTHNIGNRRAVAVACTLYSSFVLLDDGQLYSWGSCMNGQLGLGDNGYFQNEWPNISVDRLPELNQPDPVLVPGFRSKTIKQVVCGISTCMVLTSCGRMYVWGDCYHLIYRKWGICNWRPVRFAPESGKAVQIATTGWTNLLAAEFRDGTVRSWDDAAESSEPRRLFGYRGRLESGTIDEVFAPSNTMWRPVRRTAAETLGLTLNDWRTDDVCFRVDDRQIRAHKQVLVESCHYFEGMFKSTEQREYEVNHCSYDTFYAFLNYIYTGEVGPDTNWVELKDLADYYGHLDLLSQCNARPDEEAEHGNQSSELDSKIEGNNDDKKETRKKNKKFRKERKRGEKGKFTFFTFLQYLR